MKKFVSVFFTLIVFVLTIVSPVRAQQPTGFSRFVDGVRTQLQRLYLQLPGEKPGRAVLEQMTVARASVATARYTSATTVELRPDNQPSSTNQWQLEGVLNVPTWFDPATWQQQAIFQSTLVNQEVTLAATGSWVQDGPTSYVVLSEVPLIPLVNLSRAKGTWIKFQPTPGGPTALTEAQQQQLRQATTDLIQSAEVSAARRERLAGLGVFVIEVTFPDEALVTYLERVNGVYELDAGTSQARLQQLGKALQALDPLTVTLYVDRTNYYLRRTAFHLEAPLTLVGNGSQTGFVKISAETDFSEHNQPVVVDVPAAARELPAVMEEVMADHEEVGGVIDWQRVPREMQSENDQVPAELDDSE